VEERLYLGGWSPTRDTTVLPEIQIYSMPSPRLRYEKKTFLRGTSNINRIPFQVTGPRQSRSAERLRGTRALVPAGDLRSNLSNHIESVAAIMCFGDGGGQHYYREEIIPVRRHEHHHHHRHAAPRSSYKGSRHSQYSRSPRASVSSYRASAPVIVERTSRTRYS
jgi:hypothetical protein